MPSPFPGMNPYLEQDDVWHDFHGRFLPYLAEALAVLPPVRAAYIVKVDEHVFLHERSAEERLLLGRGDVFVARPGPVVAAESAAATLEAPVQGRVSLAIDAERVPYLTIRDRESRDIVTVVEVLSPSNKYAGPDREQYLAKRLQFLQSNAHLVEIDLLRGGPRLPLEDLPDCDYYVMVSRAEERPRVGLWPLLVRDRLPIVPVPLRAPDPAVHVDLQPVLDRVYDAAVYAAYIYKGRPQPRLRANDAVWAEEILRNAGLL